MGQYHFPVNISRREYINPHDLGDGLKALEHGYAQLGTPMALHMLLMGSSEKRGGGDYPDGITYGYDPEQGTTKTRDERVSDLAQAVLGRWAGDSIAIIGDYAQEGDIDIEFPAHIVYSLCVHEDDDFSEVISHLSDEDRALAEQIGPFANVTHLVRDYMHHALNIRFERTEWGGTRRNIENAY